MSTVPSGLRQQRGWQFGSNRATILWTILLLIPLLAAVAFAVLQPVKVRPRMGLAPGYLFTDQDGARLTSEDMRGKLTFYNFTYSQCAADCPESGETMRAIQEMTGQMAAAGLPVELVTIFFDPARDTPAELQAYARRFNADTSTWHLVTGDPDRLKNVIGGGFEVFYEAEGNGSYRFDPTLILVDGNGIIRARYESATPALAEIERDLGLIETEIRNSTGAGALVYEAAHLFLCYPGS